MQNSKEIQDRAEVLILLAENPLFDDPFIAITQERTHFWIRFSLANLSPGKSVLLPIADLPAIRKAVADNQPLRDAWKEYRAKLSEFYQKSKLVDFDCQDEINDLIDKLMGDPGWQWLTSKEKKTKVDLVEQAVMARYKPKYDVLRDELVPYKAKASPALKEFNYQFADYFQDVAARAADQANLEAYVAMISDLDIEEDEPAETPGY